MSGLGRYCSLIPGLGVKFSVIIPARDARSAACIAEEIAERLFREWPSVLAGDERQIPARACTFLCRHHVATAT
jgi:hypothetical protein